MAALDVFTLRPSLTVGAKLAYSFLQTEGMTMLVFVETLNTRLGTVPERHINYLPNLF